MQKTLLASVFHFTLLIQHPMDGVTAVDTAPAGKREQGVGTVLAGVQSGSERSPLAGGSCAVTTVSRTASSAGVIAHLSIHALCRAVTIKCKPDICVCVRLI